MGINKPNHARRTPQIPGSQPERASGVLNSIGNLEALSEPQAAWASGEARVRISNLRLANGQKMVGNRQSTGHRRWAMQCSVAPWTASTLEPRVMLYGNHVHTQSSKQEEVRAAIQKPRVEEIKHKQEIQVSE